MGVDVELYVMGPITDDEMDAAEEFLSDRQPGWIHSSPYRSTKGTGEPTVAVDLDCRFYGEEYERGEWPTIYTAIRLMEGAFPGHAVHYGGDNTEDHEVMTPERLDALWAHFLGPDGDGYRRRVRDREAKIASR